MDDPSDGNDSIRTAPPAPGGSRALRVLLVEDHADTLAILARHLVSCGHHVSVARNTGEALALARTSPPDLLLCDFTLPDGDGCDLLGMLADARPAICISMSGFGRKADIQRSREAGFRHHLTKPFLPDDLDALLAQL